MPDSSDRQLGRTLGGRYRLLAVIGSGASAVVYHAQDLRLDRSVAVKQLRSGYADDPRFLKLFRSEATLAAQLTHPNIMTVFDWSDDVDGVDGGPYLVTELLSGGTLRGVLNQTAVLDDDGHLVEPGLLSLSQVGFIGLQAAQGLAFAHELGLVHRDIKPANLLFGQDGRVRIGDFGIARAVAEAAWTEPEGVLIGTARYAAPEQATDAQIDGLADVYSLTLCLMEALTGNIPLVRDNALGTMVQRQTVDVPVDDDLGPLAEALRAGGRAQPSARATSAQFLDAMLAACRQLPDPEPLALLDLTEHPELPPDHTDEPHGRRLAGGGGFDDAATNANVHFDADGNLIISGDDESDLRLAGVDHPTAGATSSVAGLSPGASGAGPAPGRRRDRGRRSGGGRRWLKRLVLVLVMAALAAGAVVGGALLAESQRELATIDVSFPTFQVLDYADMTAEEVADQVGPLGWQVRSSERYQDGTLAGQMLSQKPLPGTVLEPGSDHVIELVYSLGPELRNVPLLVGATRDDAVAAIEAANLSVGEVAEKTSESDPAGVVIAATIGGQPAQPGTEFVTGTVVDLVVSSGPAPRKVPNVSTLSPDQARSAVSDVDLDLVVEEEYSRTVAEGAVIRQSPEAGTFLPRGGDVTIVVSKGLPYVAVIDVKGMTSAAANDALEGQGLKVTGVVGSLSNPAVRTEPEAGASVRLGTKITIYTG